MAEPTPLVPDTATETAIVAPAADPKAAGVVITADGKPVTQPTPAPAVADGSATAPTTPDPAPDPAAPAGGSPTFDQILTLVRDELDHYTTDGLLPTIDGIVKDALNEKFPTAAPAFVGEVLRAVPAQDQKYVELGMVIAGIVIALVAGAYGSNLWVIGAMTAALGAQLPKVSR